MLTNLIEKVGKIGFYIMGLILFGLFIYIGLTPWVIGIAIIFITVSALIYEGANHIKNQYIEGTKNVNKTFTGEDSLEGGEDISYPNQKNYPILPETYLNPNYKEEKPLYLRDFYINGSFRSYAPRGYTYDIANLKTIGYVIQKGARVIHLDVSHNGKSPLDKNAEPIVQCPQPMPKSIPLKFTDCLDIINKNAWSNNNYPMILYLTMDDKTIKNKSVCCKIASNIMSILSQRLLPMKYSFNRVPIGEIPITDALNKIIILVNNYPNTTSLDELTNGVVSSGKYAHIKNIIYSHHNLNYGGFKATHHNTQDLTEFNKSAISLIQADPTYANQFNITQPGIDVYNFDTLELHKYGCQIVLQSFQKLDKFLNNNIEFYKKSPMVLKPDYLRYISKPPIKISKQNKDLSYAPRSNKVVDPWGRPWVNNIKT